MRTALSTSSTSPPRPDPSTSAVFGARPPRSPLSLSAVSLISTRSLQYVSPEAVGEQVAHCHRLDDAGGVAEMDLRLRLGELRKPLAAAAARRDLRHALGNHRHFGD